MVRSAGAVCEGRFSVCLSFCLPTPCGIYTGLLLVGQVTLLKKWFGIRHGKLRGSFWLGFRYDS